MTENSLKTVEMPLARGIVDRDYATRDRAGFAAWFAAEPQARVLVLRAATTAVEDGALRLYRIAELPAAALERVHYLGRTLEREGGVPAGAPVGVLDAAEHEAIPESTWETLRGVGGGLSPRDTALFTEALALENWHRMEPRCSRCGEATVPAQAGWSRDCPGCGAQHFPRTDPAIIVLVTDDRDRALLGSNALWPSGQYSVLAGFVEAGESLEQAVVREVAEEAGVPVVDPVYVGSQAWPLPRSLMLGYRARVAPGFDPDTVQPDGEEILALRWLSRAQMRAEAGTLLLPGKSSIARALLDAWLREDGGRDIEQAAAASTADGDDDADSTDSTDSAEPAATGGASGSRP